MDAVAWATLVSAAAGAIGAFAAWSSARASREAVGRGNMPFVWPSYKIEYGEEDPENRVPEINTVRVAFRNDGPGIAIDVKWSTWSPTDTPDRRWLPAQWRWLPRSIRRQLARWGRDSQADAETAASASKAIRAMRPGEQETSDHTLQFLEGEPVWLVVRYTDSAGERWEYTDPGAPRDLAGRPVRVPKWDPW